MPKWFLEDPSTVWDGLDEILLRKVNRWIDRAETIITTKFPDIDKRIEREVISVEAVASVVEEMVERAIAHYERDGVEQEALPEWSVSYAQAQGMGSGSVLFLTNDEFALLAPPRQGTRLGSMRMRRAHEVEDPSPETS